MYAVYLDKQLIHDLDSEDNVLVDPTLNLELNKAGTFEFSMECTHPYYDKLERFKSIIQVLCDGDEIFKGRIIEITDDMYKERSVYCESELAYLNDAILRPHEYHLEAQAVRRYLSSVIEEHDLQFGTQEEYNNDPESVPKWFEVGITSIDDPNDYIYCYTNYNSPMEEIKEDLVDDYGGYIRIRNEYKNNDPLGTLTGRYIDYIGLEEYGRTSEQRIEFGENLLDFTNNINQADICTGIIPLGATLEESEYAAIEERVTIESVNEGSDYLIIPEAVAKYGLILKVVTWDDITEPKNLLTAAQAYLEDYDYEPQTITATAVDMHLTDEEIESWRLGDKIFVESEPHDLHKRFPLASMSIPLNQPENTTVTLGTYEDSSLSARTNKTETGLRNFENFQVGNVIASAVAQASALIKARTYGYVTIHYDEERDCADEILIMDQPNTDDATRVWRWNLNGLGYSKNGYDGDYGLAITMNGWILGDFIIANGMILADDSDIEFGKFDDKGMKIYAQSGREDLLLMRVGLGGMEVYNDETGTYTANLVRTVSVTAGYGEENSEVLFEPADNQTIVSCSLKSSSAPGYTDGVDYSASVELFSDAVMAFVHNFTVEDGITVSVTGTITVRTITTDPWLMSQIDGQGFRVYDQAGVTRSNMDVDSFDIYDSSGTLSMQLYADGLKNYDSDGTMRSFLSRSAFSTYHVNGVQSMRLEDGVLSAYDTDGTLCYMQSYSGSYYYSNGNHIGTIGASVLYSYPNEHGLVFSLTVDDEYMAFSHKDKDSDPYATIKLAYYSASCSYPEGVAFGDHAYMNNYKLYLHYGQTGGYFWALNTSDGGFYGGDFFFDGKVYVGGYEVATKNDIAGLSLLANGEEAEGDFSLYSGLQLDISELVNYKSSDETLKTSIQPISDARVDNITPVTFKWHDGDNAAHYGYIAQEVREHIPEIVKENDDGLLSLAYTEIIPLLHAKINTLEERIAKLEAIIYGEKN